MLPINTGAFIINRSARMNYLRSSMSTEIFQMIGLHKLVDIPIIGQFNDTSNTTVSAKFLISKIKGYVRHVCCF